MKKEKNTFSLHTDKIYKPCEVLAVLDKAIKESYLKGNNKGIYYYNVPCSFDIETSSFYIDETGSTIDYNIKKNRLQTDANYNPEKRAIMYVWQLGINGYVIVGRTWKEFTDTMDTISETLELNEKKRLMIFVHNLSYEFQFICKRFNWYKVFSIDLRTPIYAITETFIEFRCSYLLSGYSLANLPKQLNTYHVEKMTGDLDYSVIRTPLTPLTDKEMRYCVNDVLVVMAWIQEQIEHEKSLLNLPITKTGNVRKYCKKNCLYLPDTHKGNKKYINRIRHLTIDTLKEFNLLQRAFQGGFTHANAYYTNEVIHNVSSYDFTSSYPYVMLSEKFPMSKGVEVRITSKAQFEKLCNEYCCVFDVAFTNLMTSEINDNPISTSKCWKSEDVVENNGRVVSAKYIITTMTNVDFSYIKQFYSWESMKVTNFYVYKKDYLPTELVNCILTLYEKKTTLKGVEGMEVEYLKSKEMLNSIYGMSVTNPLRDEYLYDEVWETVYSDDVEKQSMLEQHNKSRNRFLFYPWGVFVTAYARRNLFTGIKAVGDDYIYSDTDSIKLKNGENHKAYFEAYNRIVVEKLERAMDYHGFSLERCKPKTIKGVEKLIGVWDFEGVYDTFKTLGAKRYMVEENNALKVGDKSYDVSLTVSGINKKVAVPYLVDICNGDIDKVFEMFSEGLQVPPEYTGKNLHSYGDYEITGTLDGYEYDEKSFIHLEPTGYVLSLATMYVNYLRQIKTIVL